MEKDVLSQVIDAEKEIQKCLEAEKVQVREWIDSVRKESEETFLREQQRIGESLERSVAATAAQAEATADEVVRTAAAAAERLGQLGPETLRALLARRISVILPG
jgi:hypothetical protein